MLACPMFAPTGNHYHQPCQQSGAVRSASDAVAEVAGSVRENIKLRRGFRYQSTTHAPTQRCVVRQAIKELTVVLSMRPPAFQVMTATSLWLLACVQAGWWYMGSFYPLSPALSTLLPYQMPTDAETYALCQDQVCAVAAVQSSSGNGCTQGYVWGRADCKLCTHQPCSFPGTYGSPGRPRNFQLLSDFRTTVRSQGKPS